MTMNKAIDVFINFLKEKGLHLTHQREEVLRVFLAADKHLSVEELYRLVKKKNSKVGQTTVFRTLKLLCEADLAQEIDFGDRIVRYEVKHKHGHHDHLICMECGKFIEAVDKRIEDLQDKLCKKFGFTPKKHRLEIFGICKQCKK
jgi:Fur family transcriptional regulator, ferric uptake regulator